MQLMLLKIQDKLKNAFLVFGSIFLSIAIVEISSFVTRRIIVKNLPVFLDREKTEISPKNIDLSNQIEIINSKTTKEFRLSRPKPYKDSPYFDWFINEEWSDRHPECKSKISHNGNGFNLKQEDTPNCRGYTIKNGWRVTTNQPKNNKNEILIYGGSTVQSHEVPNNHTIASYLQKYLNNKPPKYKVKNRGFTSVVTIQQLEFLKKDNLKKGDIVIFYDGGNNQWQGVAYSNPKGTIIGSNRKITFILLLKGIISRLQSYKLIQEFYKNENKTFCDFLNEKDLQENANKAFDFYKKNLLYARKYVEDRDAKFFHFMQPHLFSSEEKERSLYERTLINSPYLIPSCADKYLEIASSIFSQRHHELKKNGINSHDLSKMFEINDPRRPNGEHFLDWIHITERGNKAVAYEIFSKIKID